ncbi:MAG: beta strand repeat-containing protein [Vicinamibacterales bacterium]
MTVGGVASNGKPFTVSSGTATSIALVQHAGRDAGTTSSSTLAFPSSNTAGNWLAVLIRAGQMGQTFTVTDTRGNTYRRAQQFTQTGDGVTLGIFYAENIAGGANTVTVKDTIAGGTLRLAILEYAGVASTNSLDGTAAAEGTGTSVSSGSIGTTTSGDLAIGLASTANGVAVTAGTGFVTEQMVPSSKAKLTVEDQRLATAGPIAATARLGSSDSWGAVVAAFKPQSGSASPSPTETSLVPAIGPVGTAVTIAGANFGATKGTSTVTFNGTTATPSSWSASSIVVPVPASATTGSVMVTVGGIASNALTFTVTVTSTAPRLTSLSPTSGPVGTPVTISGTNFGATKGTSTVMFNGVSGTPTTWSASGIVVPVPNGAKTGNVTVTVGGVASNALTFTVPGATTTPIAFVQQAYRTPTSAATVTVPFSTAQAAGNLNVVVVGWNDTTRTAQTVTDTAGNVYVRAVGPTAFSGALTQSIYYAKNIRAASANTVTVRFSGTATFPDIRIAEYRGLDPLNPLDVAVGSSGSSTTSSSGSVTTTNANDLLVGANIVMQGTNAAGSGYTSRVITSPDSDILEDRVVNTVGSYSATAPTTGGGWVMQLVALRAASGGGTATTSVASFESSGGAASAAAPDAGAAITVARSKDGLRATDYDGDGKSDLATFNPATGRWAILLSATGYTTSISATLGVSTDVPVPGDYDGDGRTDIAIYRPAQGKWIILTSSSGFTRKVAYTWGEAGDLPMPGDYDGDGATDLAVYRPSTGEWLITMSAAKTTATFVLGAVGDVPVAGDFDGDHRADIGVFTPSTGAWTIRTSSTNYTTGPTLSLGAATDVAVPGDYDGDGLTDIAVYTPSTGRWSILSSTTSYSSMLSVTLGGGDAIPVPGNYDTDGAADVAVYHPSTGRWSIVASADGSTMTLAWGAGGSVPAPRRR